MGAILRLNLASDERPRPPGRDGRLLVIVDFVMEASRYTDNPPPRFFNRLNEVSFNAVLIKELYMMALLRRNAARLADRRSLTLRARIRRACASTSFAILS
jgi:hypothetical protein